jgi:hypothetical protein
LYKCSANGWGGIALGYQDITVRDPEMAISAFCLTRLTASLVSAMTSPLCVTRTRTPAGCSRRAVAAEDEVTD